MKYIRIYLAVIQLVSLSLSLTSLSLNNSMSVTPTQTSNSFGLKFVTVKTRFRVEFKASMSKSDIIKNKIAFYLVVSDQQSISYKYNAKLGTIQPIIQGIDVTTKPQYYYKGDYTFDSKPGFYYQMNQTYVDGNSNIQMYVHVFQIDMQGNSSHPSSYSSYVPYELKAYQLSKPSSQCPFNCNNKAVCANYKCKCPTYYYGGDCSVKIKFLNFNQQIIGQISTEPHYYLVTSNLGDISTIYMKSEAMRSQDGYLMMFAKTWKGVANYGSDYQLASPGTLSLRSYINKNQLTSQLNVHKFQYFESLKLAALGIKEKQSRALSHIFLMVFPIKDKNITAAQYKVGTIKYHIKYGGPQFTIQIKKDKKQEKKDDEGGLSGGAIAGIVIGSIVGFIFLLICCCTYCKRRRASSQRWNHRHLQVEVQQQSRQHSIIQSMAEDREIYYDDKKEDYMDTYLPKKKFFKLDRQGSKQEFMCGVCLIEFEPHEEVRITLCNHIIHQECIDAWMKKQKNCPFCRQPLDEQSVRKWFEETENAVKYQDYLKEMEIQRQMSLGYSKVLRQQDDSLNGSVLLKPMNKNEQNHQSMLNGDNNVQLSQNNIMMQNHGQNGAHWGHANMFDNMDGLSIDQEYRVDQIQNQNIQNGVVGQNIQSNDHNILMSRDQSYASNHSSAQRVSRLQRQRL